MTNPPRELLDYLAALTDDELTDITRTARSTTERTSPMPPEIPDLDAQLAAARQLIAFHDAQKPDSSQLTDADLARLTPAEINQARRAGHLNALLGRG